MTEISTIQCFILGTIYKNKPLTDEEIIDKYNSIIGSLIMTPQKELNQTIQNLKTILENVLDNDRIVNASKELNKSVDEYASNFLYSKNENSSQNITRNISSFLDIKYQPVNLELAAITADIMTEKIKTTSPLLCTPSPSKEFPSSPQNIETNVMKMLSVN